MCKEHNFENKELSYYWKTYYNASTNGTSVDEAIARMQPMVQQPLNY